MPASKERRHRQSPIRKFRSDGSSRKGAIRGLTPASCRVYRTLSSYPAPVLFSPFYGNMERSFLRKALRQFHLTRRTGSPLYRRRGLCHTLHTLKNAPLPIYLSSYPAGIRLRINKPWLSAPAGGKVYRLPYTYPLLRDYQREYNES